ncbi:universal stress protein [Nocardioides sp.]|uniref:universal stress protein n=1 Tax=Nocardioides sp. TaxID=35761 RepID=UPI003D14553D
MENTTVQPGSIVVGVDGSTASDRALYWAVDQALLENRSLTLAHGVGPHSIIIDQAGVDRLAILDAMREDGHELLERARTLALGKAPELVVDMVLRMQDARIVLLELSHQASMLVLGSHGRGPVRSLLLGSVGLAVSEQASCPVVVLRPEHVGVVRRGVLVGIDGTPESAGTLEVAYRLASLRGLPLEVMHCYWDVRGYDLENGVEEERLLVSETLSGMGEKYPEVHVTRTISRGLPDKCLLEAARRMDAVVVGSRPKTFAENVFFGSVSRGVLEHADSVVVVVPQ